MYDLPDHPVIHSLETTGYPDDGPCAVCTCACCGEDILEGDTAYHIAGGEYCESCVEDARYEVYAPF